MLVIFSIIISVFVTEVFLRFYRPDFTFNAGSEIKWIGNNPYATKVFTPYEAWSSREKKARDKILQILKDLQLRYFDLFESFNTAVQNEVSYQESPGDPWHPSDDIANVFAKYLSQYHLL